MTDYAEWVKKFQQWAIKRKSTHAAATEMAQRIEKYDSAAHPNSLSTHLNERASDVGLTLAWAVEQVIEEDEQ